MDRLRQFETCRQSLWLDHLQRSLIEGGGLRTPIERDGLKGLTANPSIFEKAIGETDEHADAFRQITCDDASDIDVPGHAYTFGVVKAAQARGDWEVRVDRGRRALRVHLKHVDTGLAERVGAVDAAFE